jgi:hypothetical protein
MICKQENQEIRMTPQTKNHQEAAYSFLKGEFAIFLKVKYEPVFLLRNIPTKWNEEPHLSKPLYVL